MSAHFVDDAVIDDVCALYRAARNGPCDLDAFGRGLLRLNCESVTQRYDLDRAGAEHAEMKEAAAAYRFTPPDSDVAQQAMSLRCLRDQSCFGECMKTGLYKVIEAIADAIGKPDGYENAIWSREA